LTDFVLTEIIDKSSTESHEIDGDIGKCSGVRIISECKEIPVDSEKLFFAFSKLISVLSEAYAKEQEGKR